MFPLLPWFHLGWCFQRSPLDDHGSDAMDYNCRDCRDITSDWHAQKHHGDEQHDEEKEKCDGDDDDDDEEEEEEEE